MPHGAQKRPAVTWGHSGGRHYRTDGCGQRPRVPCAAGRQQCRGNAPTLPDMGDEQSDSHTLHLLPYRFAKALPLFKGRAFILCRNHTLYCGSGGFFSVFLPVLCCLQISSLSASSCLLCSLSPPCKRTVLQQYLSSVRRPAPGSSPCALTRPSRFLQKKSQNSRGNFLGLVSALRLIKNALRC